MTWGTCYKSNGNTLNNIYSELPPLMSDQRLFTSYDPNYETNETFMEKNNITSNYEYRQYLTQNADSIMEENRQNVCNDSGICVFSQTGFKQRNKEGKYLYSGHSDTTRPYGYEDSNMKSKYVSEKALESRMSAPILNQQQLLQYPRSK